MSGYKSALDNRKVQPVTGELSLKDTDLERIIFSKADPAVYHMIPNRSPE